MSDENDKPELALLREAISDLRRQVYCLRMQLGNELQCLKLAVEELAKVDMRPIDDDGDWWKTGGDAPFELE